MTGKALSHVTAGLRPAALHRAAPDYFAGSAGVGRYEFILPIFHGFMMPKSVFFIPSLIIR